MRCYLSFDWNRFDFFLVLCGMGEVTISPHLPTSPYISRYLARQLGAFSSSGRAWRPWAARHA